MKEFVMWVIVLIFNGQENVAHKLVYYSEAECRSEVKWRNEMEKTFSSEIGLNVKVEWECRKALVKVGGKHEK